MDRAAEISCVLPAFNEAGSLPTAVAGWSAALTSRTSDHEIIVVDDGSTDDTGAVLRDLAARFPRLRILTHPTNLGYGVAISNAFAQARFPLLFFTDADAQYEPDDVGRLLEHIATADLVVGYRFSRADPAIRLPVSRGYNFVARHLLGVSLRDVNCAFKLMHRDAFRRLDVASTGFSFSADLAASARHAGMTIVEVPVRHLPRHAGGSKVRPFHVVSSVYQLIQVRRRRRRRGSAASVAVAGHGRGSFQKTDAVRCVASPPSV